MLRYVRQISLGIVRDIGARRTAMASALVGATALLFVGSTFLAGSLLRHPVLFCVWWGACAWLTLLAMLLALYDLAAVRKAARERRRQLIRDLAGHLPPEPPDRPEPPDKPR